ncbi:hypothetical protein E2C01_095701 [Portunus trituberculatus]|uniref:Uncharacterized protein n=1 Tax=Portunus trituberculatus TaxID=210409 RepID=A0A5B7JTP5_PORTR|nr:hypothetical protein [Portunus trituberculatus]
MAGEKDEVMSGGAGAIGDEAGGDILVSGGDNLAGVEVVVSPGDSDDVGGGDSDECVVLTGRDDVFKVLLRRKDSSDQEEEGTPKGTRRKKNSFIKIRLEEETEEEEEEEEEVDGVRMRKKEGPVSQCPACLGCPDSRTERCVLIGLLMACFHWLREGQAGERRDVIGCW